MTKVEYLAEADDFLEGMDNIGTARPAHVQIHTDGGKEVGAWVQCWLWIDNTSPEEEEDE